ncbi:kinase-like protein [Hymenopellis radicata]|nr:kinase-like protein [Hymenopellis radicata]
MESMQEIRRERERLERTWRELSLNDANDQKAVLRLVAQVTSQLASDSPAVWRTIGSVPRDAALYVMNILQTELDASSTVDAYRSTCLKCLRVLTKKHEMLPDSFFCRQINREGSSPICGGGFGDIWKGTLTRSQTPVCLKVLRVFGNNVDKILKAFCHEALLWRQLRHPRLLPFLGVVDDLFPHSFCLVSPWMENGNIMQFLIKNPTHDRFQSVLEIAEAITYLHALDPQIVHADIRGNVLVSDDGHCLLGDFGISVMVETQAPGSSTRLRGAVRWIAPEMMDATLYDPSYLSARDIYSFGCTIIEVSFSYTSSCQIYSGKPPFYHLRSDPAVISEVVVHRRTPPRPPHEQFPSDDLWDLVVACLSPCPKDRPSATVLYQFLHSLNLSSTDH